MTDPSTPDLTAATALIRGRRSIKPADMDAGREVPRELLMTLLENASWAPTHGLTEPWRFHLFCGEARRALGENLQRIYREITPASEFRDDKYEKLVRNPLLAPVVIAACMERRGGQKIPEIEEIAAVCCAVQNLALSATAAGLASYWSSPPAIYSRAFTDWLGMGAEDRCLGLIYLGWPRAGAAPPKSSRTAIGDKLRFV